MKNLKTFKALKKSAVNICEMLKISLIVSGEHFPEDDVFHLNIRKHFTIFICYR